MNKISTRQLWMRGAVSAVIAAVVNTALSALSAGLLGAPAFRALQPGPVVTVTIVTVMAGTAVFAILNRLLSRPTRVFSLVSAAIAVLSLIAPIGLSLDPSTFPGATTASALALIPLHLIPAAILIAAFAWRRSGVTA